MRIARPSRRAFAVLAPVALAAVAIPSVAVAAGSSSSGHVFNACVDESGYVWVSYMDADPQCAQLQAYLATDPGDGSGGLSVTLTQVSWNEKGQDGLQGVPGAAGAAGLAGAKGADGVSGYVTVTKSVSVAKHKTATVSLACPTGKKVTGGGAQPGSDSVTLLGSYPSANNAGWFARVANDSGSKQWVKLYAICAAA